MPSRRFRKRCHADDAAPLRFDVPAQVGESAAQHCGYRREQRFPLYDQSRHAPETFLVQHVGNERTRRHRIARLPAA